MLAKLERERSPATLLDLGPWVGFYMAEARRAGGRPQGSSRAPSPRQYARERLGLDVRSEDLYEAELPESGFDAVLMGDVLEHLTRTDEALSRVRRWLSPGGVLVLLSPTRAAGSRGCSGGAGGR